MQSCGTPTISEDAAPVSHSNASPLAVAVWRKKMHSKCSNLQLDFTNNIKLCASLARGLSALVDPEVPALRKPTIWTWPFLLKLALLDEPLSIQEIIAEFTKRFTWCRGLDASWKMYSYAEVYSKLSDSEIVLCEHSETFHGGKGSCWPANVQSCGPLKILVRPGKLRQRVFPEIGFLRAFFSKFPNVNSLRITRGSSCKDIIGTFPGNEWFRSGRSHPIYKTDRGERPIQGLAGRLLMTSYNRYKWL
ncbi:hypothetical protein R3P38DRAFT_3358072 [Favolaschia claudopus]|uniref:Maturase K n=1 Tax=Favolaschia claudopus TaxID=2862362 RepID=A0AAW0B6G4_9AGAR